MVKNTPRNEFAALWNLDPQTLYLNHGSFGACPLAVLEKQRELRLRMEHNPLRFLDRELEASLDQARRELGEFVGANPDDLVFVPNATSGVNTVLASIPLGPGDELLVTDHEYNACRNAIEAAARRNGAKVVVACVPFPLSSPDQVIEAVLAATTKKTKLALLDHITSQTALVLPVARLTTELAARGVETMVDGAHGPGMVPLHLEQLGAAYYTGNCHKWLCTPKGAAFLHVRREAQARIRPLITSHGFNSPRTDRTRFRLEFDWTGTIDPTAYLCIPEAIRFMGALLPGGWPELMSRNRELALTARDKLCRTFKTPPPCPDEMLGAMAALPIPDGDPCAAWSAFDPLQRELFEKFAIETPIISWPARPKRLLRVSAQLYNTPAQYDLLIEALGQLLNRR